MENPIKMDDLGVPLFLEITMCWKKVQSESELGYYELQLYILQIYQAVQLNSNMKQTDYPASDMLRILSKKNIPRS